jgi:predicted Zn finger-like uncharacterized protein
MKVQCPQCGASYQIEDSRIPEKGALATCKKCKNRFQVKRGAPQAESPTKVETSEDLLIPCPDCGHWNISSDKCESCGRAFTSEEKGTLATKLVAKGE